MNRVLKENFRPKACVSSKAETFNTQSSMSAQEKLVLNILGQK